MAVLISESHWARVSAGVSRQLHLRCYIDIIRIIECRSAGQNLTISLLVIAIMVGQTFRFVGTLQQQHPSKVGDPNSTIQIQSQCRPGGVFCTPCREAEGSCVCYRLSRTAYHARSTFSKWSARREGLIDQQARLVTWLRLQSHLYISIHITRP